MLITTPRMAFPNLPKRLPLMIKFPRNRCHSSSLPSSPPGPAASPLAPALSPDPADSAEILTLLSPRNKYIRPFGPTNSTWNTTATPTSTSSSASSTSTRPTSISGPSYLSSTPPSPPKSSQNQNLDLEKDFILHPTFLSKLEQSSLLRMALHKLDRAEGNRKRRRRRSSPSASFETSATALDVDQSSRDGLKGPRRTQTDLQDIFKPDLEAYTFHPAHFDSVISDYRETLLSNFPAPSSLVSEGCFTTRGLVVGSDDDRNSGRTGMGDGDGDGVEPPYTVVMAKLFGLLGLVSPSHPLLSPTPILSSSPPPTATSDSSLDLPFLPPLRTITHALHLSPAGSIRSHVDNVDASGEVILGVSLGGERVLRLERVTESSPDSEPGSGSSLAIATSKDHENRKEKEERKQGWDVLLPSGSVYVQRSSVRYGCAHSILGYDEEGSSGWEEWEGEVRDGNLSSGREDGRENGGREVGGGGAEAKDGKKEIARSQSRLRPGHRVSLMIRDGPVAPKS